MSPFLSRSEPRLARGLHQRVYARALGVKLAHLVAWEDGHDVPPEVAEKFLVQHRLHAAYTDLHVSTGEDHNLTSTTTFNCRPTDSAYPILVGVGLSCDRLHAARLERVECQARNLISGYINAEEIMQGEGRVQGRRFIWLSPVLVDAFSPLYVQVAPTTDQAPRVRVFTVFTAHKEWYE